MWTAGRGGEGGGDPLKMKTGSGHTRVKADSKSAGEPREGALFGPGIVLRAPIP